MEILSTMLLRVAPRRRHPASGCKQRAFGRQGRWMRACHSKPLLAGVPNTALRQQPQSEHAQAGWLFVQRVHRVGSSLLCCPAGLASLVGVILLLSFGAYRVLNYFSEYSTSVLCLSKYTVVQYTGHSSASTHVMLMWVPRLYCSHCAPTGHLLLSNWCPC